MDFYEVLDQVIDLLRNRGRVTYRALKAQFHLDDEQLETLREEILYAHESGVQADDRGFVWTGDTTDIQVTTTSQPDQPETQPTTQEEPPTQVKSLPTEPHAPDAERRQLTILFTDLVDSTKLSGQLDAEDYREIVRAYQAACAEVIERFDCTLVQTLGDGLLVYSGYPVAHENDAERAVRAGLGILDAMKSLNERLEQEKGIRLSIRIGIHTGPVVVGDVGAGSRQEQLALGEVPNVAARIQGLAEPDTVVISAATYRLIEGYFECQELGEQTLRGVAEPITVYQVLQESGAQSRLDVASTRGLTPLVGREQEVGLLLDRWHQTKDGQGQVVLLSGEGGIGKSRLIQVLKDHVADEPHTRWECRSLPYYQNSALYPIIDLIQRTFQWHQDDTPEERLTTLEQQLRQYRLPLEESVPLFAPLLSLSVPEDRYPPLTLSPQRQRQKTLESIVAILLELAERQPLLFVLEDLHWTDPTTLELLELLLDQIPTAPIYTLLTCRPTFQSSWSSRSYLTQVTLSHLARRQIEQMATQVAGGKSLPTAIVQQLVDKTDGVPLYCEEMTKTVLESGLLKETDGHYELTGPASSLSIPTTLQDSLMSRLDRLVTAKAVAQYASVVGRQFSYELLQVVSQLDEMTLQRELRRLVEAELVYQRGLPPQTTYAFKHALIQDAAYASLLKSTRQQYHQRIAQVLETQFPETVEHQPELLAHHCTEAGLYEQAIEYWRKAGEQAVQRFAYMEGIAHLTKGLEHLRALSDTPERIQQELALLNTLGPALMAMKGHAAPEVESTYARARVLCRQVEDSPQLFTVLIGLRLFYMTRGELQTACEVGEHLLQVAQRQHDTSLLVEAHRALGHNMLTLGELQLARSYMEQGMALYDPYQHHSHAFLYGQDPAVACRGMVAFTLWLLGCPDQALQRSEEALTLAQELAHPYSVAFASIGVATLSLFRRAPHKTRERAETAMAYCAEQGFAQYLSNATILYGWALSMQGRAEEGIVKIASFGRTIPVDRRTPSSHGNMSGTQA